MAQPPIIHSVTEFIELTFTKEFSVGLGDTPVRPWYLGQASASDNIMPPLYRANIEPVLEREMLREFRMRASEFHPAQGVPDEVWPLLGHQNGLPLRLQEWTGNPLVALFLAVESMAASEGQVWIFNPWYYNELTSGIALVPMTAGDIFREKYVVKLNDPDAPEIPAAEAPMAFKAFRNIRPHIHQDVYFTCHGHLKEPLNELRFFLRKPKTYVQRIIIAGPAKKIIMKELHLIGMNRANLFPGAPSIARTVSYAMSRDFLETDI